MTYYYNHLIRRRYLLSTSASCPHLAIWVVDPGRGGLLDGLPGRDPHLHLEQDTSILWGETLPSGHCHQERDILANTSGRRASRIVTNQLFSKACLRAAHPLKHRTRREHRQSPRLRWLSDPPPEQELIRYHSLKCYSLTNDSMTYGRFT